MLKIKKKTFILVLSYLVAAVLALGGYALAQTTVGGAYGETSRDGYRHALDEAAAAVADLDGLLGKCAYATGSEMTETLCTRVYGDCLAAQMTLSALPFSTQELEQTEGYLGRMGDYAYTLCRTAPENGGFSDTERKSLGALAQTARQLSGQLQQIQADVAAGNVLMDDPENTVRQKSDEYRNAVTLSASMLKNESAFPEQAELEYDGKYGYRAASGGGSDIVTEGEALKTAAAFLNMDESLLSLQTVSSGGKLSYLFKVTVADGEGCVTVDGQSGLVRAFTDSRVPAGGELTEEKAVQTAQALIKKGGYGGVALVKAESSDGAVNCEFVPLWWGWRCEAQRITVSIATDNGGLRAFDASDYIDHAKTRTAPAALLPDAVCRAALPDSLTVKESRLSVLESPGGSDVWCREYVCADGGDQRVTVFVSAVSGRQQEIAVG